LNTVVLVGSPNVGKSVIFNYLTGAYATVSNYPGTTVDVSHGKSKINGNLYEIIDTPGMYSLTPFTEEERVTRQLLCTKKSDVLIHVVDTKNIRRMISMTLQLMDAGFPVILNLNIIDEAKQAGIIVNTELLSAILGIPVVATAAVRKAGLDNLKKEVRNYKYRKGTVFKFSDDIENIIDRVSSKLTHNYPFSKRMTALLLLAGDDTIQRLAATEPAYLDIADEIKAAAEKYEYGIDYELTVQRQAIVEKILASCMIRGKPARQGLMEKLGCWTRKPITGIPILCLVLYIGLYQIVGKFGAGFLVDYIDNNIFARYINPQIEHIVNQHIPWAWMQSLVIGEYGVFSLGFRYAVVIILPIVGTFFLVFALLEDCGYLPRLAMLVDRIFKYLGLNGRAVIPMTLGLGCGTMAVMVTRTLETRRERVLATFLLALTIPCSAQLGVILALLSHNNLALMLWTGYIVTIFIIVGWITAHILPGQRSSFYLEIPPLRLPLLSNIVTKAWMRMFWYFIEILPVFIVTSLIMWFADRSGALLFIVKLVEPVIRLLGLPTETAQAFLLGFFRRDYGAAGLYDMSSSGLLTDRQLLIAAVTLTLFIPCVAQLAVMVKERGLKLTLLMVFVISLLAFSAGYLMSLLLTVYNIPL